MGWSMLSTWDSLDYPRQDASCGGTSAAESPGEMLREKYPELVGFSLTLLLPKHTALSKSHIHLRLSILITGA